MPDAATQITPEQFVEKWKGRGLSERGGSHVHFIELCRMLGVPYPHEHRSDDTGYCFDALTDAAGSRLYAAAKGNAGPPPRPPGRQARCTRPPDRTARGHGQRPGPPGWAPAPE